MRRINRNTFDKVEIAIKLANKGLIKEAAALCKALNVPIDVAYRVILKPSKRRKGN